MAEPWLKNTVSMYLSLQILQGLANVAGFDKEVLYIEIDITYLVLFIVHIEHNKYPRFRQA